MMLIKMTNRLHSQIEELLSVRPAPIVRAGLVRIDLRIAQEWRHLRIKMLPEA